MSKSNGEQLELNKEIISDKELYEIFEFQYDDLFCKILKISQKSFTYFLKQQVLFHLQIIKRNSLPEIFKAYLDLFTKRYKENYKLAKKNYGIIKQKEQEENNDLLYLDVTKCFIHCHKCFNIVHKCGKKLVIFEDYFYCIKCKNVYNRNQILLFCQECNKNYLSKIRKPVFNGNKKFEKLFLLKFKKYHCETNKDEKIKCLKCSNNLYFRLTQNNQAKENNINIIYCIKCKLKYSVKDVFFKCKICLTNFKAEAKLYRDFTSKNKKLLFVIHTLLRNKNALPNFNLCKRTCPCELEKVKEFLHKEDNGKFLEGIRNNKSSVVCSKCFKLFKYDEVNWTCPQCGEEFKYTNNKKIIKSNNNLIDLGIEIEEIKELKKIPVFKVNLGNNKMNEFNYEKGNKKIIENWGKSNEMIKESEDTNNIRILMNKKDDNIINSDLYKITQQNIPIIKNESNKINIKTKYALRKSKSKNDITVKKYRHSNKNADLIKKKNKDNNIKIQPREKSKDKNLNNLIKENSKNQENNLEKNPDNEKNLKEKNDETKSVNTQEIFNKIKNNIYNEEESNFNLDRKVENDNEKQKNVNNKEKEINIKPKHKKTQCFGNKELNINNLHKDKSFYFDNNYLNNFEIQEQYVNNYIDSNGNIKNCEIFNNNLMENSGKKHIRYTKKVYFFNGKNDRKIIKKNSIIQPNNLFKKNMNNEYFNRNKISNLYENNEEFVFSNDSSYQNYENYEMIYPNYKEYQQINLYTFSSDNYATIKLLGKGANGKIYLVFDKQTNQNFALKSILVDNEFQLKSEEDEHNLIYRLTYENPDLKIVNIYGLEIRRINEFNIFFNVLMEAAISDWESEIISRKKNKKYYKEEELLYILSNLITTLSYLQQRNISHRDLKPQNILYFGNNEYKICDFGEAKYSWNKNNKLKNEEINLTFDDSQQTIRGTELYMSPILFKAMKYKPNSLTSYNCFKSDVFSLGLCFLHASSLDTAILYKIREIFDMEKIVNIVYENLARRYSQNYINMILYMLQIDENYRPDFIELNSWLNFGNNSTF